MRHVMQHPSFGGEPVLLPEPLDVNERRLAEAIYSVLQR
jgi:hypothetical protein